MASLVDRIGVCSWSLQPQNAQELVARVRECGVKKLQLALNPLSDEPEAWADTGRLCQQAGIRIVSGMFGCIGEDYSTLESIRQTGGLVLDADWQENFAIAERAMKHAKTLGVRTITTHVGFIPHDERDPDYAKMVERVRAIADLYARESIALLTETGQETADDLWTFLDRVDRENVGINFDPANMILYDQGDPVEALRKLLPRVRQVHLKDATRTKTPGTWGAETPLGKGAVDWPAFLAVLDGAGFSGDLVIEREGGDRRVEEVNLARERILAIGERERSRAGAGA